MAHLLLGFVLGDTVALLNPPEQLLALAGDHVDVVVGELAPLFLDLARQLFPGAFDTIVVHGVVLSFHRCPGRDAQSFGASER